MERLCKRNNISLMGLRHRAVLLLGALLVVGLYAPAVAQDGPQAQPPQILTTDLVQRQVVQSPKKTVQFVLVSESKITRVMINGKAQAIHPADTVVLTKQFQFNPGNNFVEVVAFDNKGNSRQKNFLVTLVVPQRPLVQH